MDTAVLALLAQYLAGLPAFNATAPTLRTEGGGSFVLSVSVTVRADHGQDHDLKDAEAAAGD